MKIFLILPLVVLALGFLLGLARLYRTLVFFVIWLTMCSVLYMVSIVYAIGHYESMSGWLGVIAAVLLALPSLWIATLFSFVTSPRESPAPLQHAFNVYEALDDEKKKRVHFFAKSGLSFAVKHGSNYLRNKGFI